MARDTRQEGRQTLACDRKAVKVTGDRKRSTSTKASTAALDSLARDYSSPGDAFRAIRLAVRNLRKRKTEGAPTGPLLVFRHDLFPGCPLFLGDRSEEHTSELQSR